jgi:hypothetical protein
MWDFSDCESSQGHRRSEAAESPCAPAEIWQFSQPETQHTPTEQVFPSPVDSSPEVLPKRARFIFGLGPQPLHEVPGIPSKGRPFGTLGSPVTRSLLRAEKARRNAAVAPHQLAGQVASNIKLLDLPQGAAKSVLEVLRPVGAPIHKHVIESFQRIKIRQDRCLLMRSCVVVDVFIFIVFGHGRHGSYVYDHRYVSIVVPHMCPEDTAVEEEVNYCLGPLPRHVMSIAAEAALLSKPRSDVQTMSLRLGAAVHFASRAFAGSLASHIGHYIQTDQGEPIAAFLQGAYDETPMPFRIANLQMGRKFPETSDTLALPSSKGHLQIITETAKQTQNCKVLQSEHTMVFLLQVKRSDRYLCLSCPLSCPLQTCDRCPAEVLVQFIKEQTCVPMLQDVRALFPLNIDQIVCDRGSNNIRAENSMGDATVNRSTTHCGAHMASTVQGISYKPVTSVIAGNLAFALAQRPGGALCKLRQELVEVLLLNATHVQQEPPGPDDPNNVHIDWLLDICIPADSEANSLRRLCYKQSLCGSNVQLTPISFYTLVDEPDMKGWATSLAAVMLPRAIPKFARTRWLTTAIPIQESTLLANTHHVLRQVVPRWVAVLQGKPKPPLKVQSRRAWDFESSDEEVDPAVFATVDAPSGDMGRSNRFKARSHKMLCFSVSSFHMNMRHVLAGIHLEARACVRIHALVQVCWRVRMLHHVLCVSLHAHPYNPTRTLEIIEHIHVFKHDLRQIDWCLKAGDAEVF